SEEEFTRALKEFRPTLILSDFSLTPDFDGMKALSISRKLAPDVPFIFVSGAIGEEQAIKLVKSGATDYVLKTNIHRLATVIMRALQEKETLLARRKAEKEIEEQWKFFRKVIDIDRNLIFVKNRDGKFLLVNNALAEIFGTTVDNIIGRTNADFINNGEAIERFRKDEQEVIDKQQEKFFPEVKITDADGNTRWLQTTMRPMISVHYKEDLVLGVATDITERKRMEDELRENIERYEIISMATNDAVWDWDITTDSLWWSEGFSNLFGYRKEEIIPTLEFWVNCIYPEDRERIENSINLFLKGTDQYWYEEYRFNRKDGSCAYVYDRGFLLRDKNGQAIRMIGTMMDITERYEQEMRIKRLSRIREVMSDINFTIVRVRDKNTLFNEACRIAVERGGFALAWIGMMNKEDGMVTPVASYGEHKDYPDILTSYLKKNVPRKETLVYRMLQDNKPVVVNDIASKNDLKDIPRNKLLEKGFRSSAKFPISVGGNSVGAFTLYSNDTGIFDEEEIKLLDDLVADISFAIEYIEKEQQLDYLAYYDVLTGLSNRKLLTERVTQALHSVDSDNVIALILIDIERFSYINEVYGRHGGDLVLKQVSRKLNNITGKSDHVARADANAFAILLTGINDASGAARFLENKLIPALSDPVAINEQELKISINSGVAIAPNDGEDAETLYKNAEVALKSAKVADDRYMFYARNMNAQIAEKLTLENKLRLALEKDQFILYYQPKIRLSDNKIIGMEALIRWNSDAGLVAPGKFIPILESTGLILDVGHWVIKKAIGDYRLWHEKGLEPPPVAVNISPIQIRQSNFIERIDEIISEYAGSRLGLELEITETIIMMDLEENIKRLSAIRNRDIDISIDDFGTGYSSLRYMSKLPVTTLKIDRDFINGMIENENDRAIVSTIISLAHSLKLYVIAEGVETNEQKDLLKSLKCDYYQGFLYSKPIPFQDIESLLTKQ
ncbi:MAG TPA: EAL domain-containing protein, partial [Gammaproteobacteria bacterium]|nr:EAL domain-containing protein [Gammaproteobacteria bacterium]